MACVLHSGMWPARLTQLITSQLHGLRTSYSVRPFVSGRANSTRIPLERQTPAKMPNVPNTPIGESISETKLVSTMAPPTNVSEVKKPALEGSGGEPG